jgi:hypothetical protein
MGVPLWWRIKYEHRIYEITLLVFIY